MIGRRRCRRAPDARHGDAPGVPMERRNTCNFCAEGSPHAAGLAVVVMVAESARRRPIDLSQPRRGIRPDRVVWFALVEVTIPRYLSVWKCAVISPA